VRFSLKGYLLVAASIITPNSPLRDIIWVNERNFSENLPQGRNLKGASAFYQSVRIES
jgi:hypothetical protein